MSAVVSDGGAVQRLSVSLDDGSGGSAINYPDLSGTCATGDRVLLNTTAVDLALGTGGTHFVVAREGAGRGVALDSGSGGHVMKLRYTPLQRDVLAVESQESPFHEVMAAARSVDGMPVVCCGLHSQVPLVAAAIKQADPALRVAYCMTDQAALPMALSGIVAQAVEAGLIDETISCGQAFGGGLEAINLHSALLAARHVAFADIAVVAIGPGVVGTATPFGHGGIGQGEALNAAAAVGGTPIACLRLSFADERERHRVVSHHSIAALTRVAMTRCLVAVPTLPGELAGRVDAALQAAGIWGTHERADARAGTQDAPNLRGLTVTTMRRGFADDPAFYFAAYAAGEVAARSARPKISDNH
ncbi:MAG: DUF3866 family protein [Coriobacteriia bacterium]|nr:DUF3866 family protein [Coriobacteriia bacterium]